MKKNDILTGIVCSYGSEGEGIVKMDGMTIFLPFAIPGEKVRFKVLKVNNSDEICDTEKGYSYQFPNISVGVYREAIPEEITEMIEEATRFGNPLSSDEIQNEMRRANHWATIGCGSACYYQR